MTLARGGVIRLTSPADGFSFEAYHAAPPDARQGGLVLIADSFGVTEAIRGLADGFAEAGYEVIAPSMFDRAAGPAVPLHRPSGGPPPSEGEELSPRASEVEGDLNAAIAVLAGPVFVAGYGWGGTATWLAACRCPGVAAASCFYGRQIPELIGETPRCPTILHFGKHDAAVPMETVERIGAAHPDLPIYLYDAGHGFVSERSADHHADSARLARLRTLQLFQRSGGVRGEH